MHEKATKIPKFKGFFLKQVFEEADEVRATRENVELLRFAGWLNYRHSAVEKNPRAILTQFLDLYLVLYS